ncbi:MAG: glycoside hydrolase family 3, partial [Dehalococcoidia bacterium]|nr:glycoside hydrolase family 3 [Dehalococcoidia bacterium]
HFPGHGSSAGDSHFGFVDVTGTWSERELQPYSELIAGGFEDLVMAAHVFNATLDAEHPASLSSQTITGLLRRDLGFQGAVISDDMAMAAITENYGFEEAIDLAIRAGVDILLYGNNGPGFDEVVAFRAIDHLAQSVNEGKLSKDRIDESYRRIAALKSRLQ